MHVGVFGEPNPSLSSFGTECFNKFLGYLNEFSQPLTYDIYENSMENILVNVRA